MKTIPELNKDKLPQLPQRPMVDFKSKLHQAPVPQKRSHVPIGRCYGRPRG